MEENIIFKLINDFQKLKGLGPKSAERLVYSILELENENIINMADNIKNLAVKIKKCDICNIYMDDNGCKICNNRNLKSKKILVVEKHKDLTLFEKNNIFDGRYHVLGNLISPMNGIGPNIEGVRKLINRINNKQIEELILAIKPSLEGEATSQYIKEICEKNNVHVSKIAIGIPMGADFEYLDPITLELALKDRRDV